MKRWLTLLLVALQILACCFGNVFFGTACPASIARAESQYRTLKSWAISKKCPLRRNTPPI